MAKAHVLSATTAVAPNGFPRNPSWRTSVSPWRWTVRETLWVVTSSWRNLTLRLHRYLGFETIFGAFHKWGYPKMDRYLVFEWFGDFHKWGYPIAGWFISWRILWKFGWNGWVGGTPISGNLHSTIVNTICLQNWNNISKNIYIVWSMAFQLVGVFQIFPTMIIICKNLRSSFHMFRSPLAPKNHEKSYETIPVSFRCLEDFWPDVQVCRGVQLYIC